MKACVLYDVASMEVRDVPRPAVLPDHVLVRVSAVGICGTDTHIFAGHANYNTDETGRAISLATQPQILGHEITGVIEETGSAVRDLKAGDRVVLDQGINCVSARRTRLCEYCRSGDSHQCEFYREHGITGLQGGLAEFIAIPGANAVLVTSPLGNEEAALVEPLGCIIHSSDAVSRAHGRYGINAEAVDRRVRHILVCGAGPAGLLFVQYLRQVLKYDGVLLVVEPNPTKRNLAVHFGADEGLDPGSCDIAAAVKERSGGKGVEYLIEASGQGNVFASIPRLIRKQATVLLYGHGHAGTELRVLNNVMFKEPTLVTPVGASGGFESDGRPAVYRRALQLVEQRHIEVAPIVSHRYSSLDAVPGALSHEMHFPDYVKGVVTLA
jgi:threonine dehydrogenase-like Zn-dependent dehydrogenase